MYVYQFLPAEYALQDLRSRRLKVSTLVDMNDPFEMLGAALRTPEAKVKFGWLKAQMSRNCRLLCFSKKSDNPLMWSHYADKHCGICLGFVVPKDRLLEVSYASNRLELQVEKSLLKDGASHELARKLLTMKFSDWSYEEEVRMEVHQTEIFCDGPLHFVGFSTSLQLFKVLIGSRCSVSKKDIQAALQPEDRHAVIVRTRPAFQSFRIIPTPVAARRDRTGRHNSSTKLNVAGDR